VSRSIPVDDILLIHRCENLKSCISSVLYVLDHGIAKTSCRRVLHYHVGPAVGKLKWPGFFFKSDYFCLSLTSLHFRCSKPVCGLCNKALSPSQMQDLWYLTGNVLQFCWYSLSAGLMAGFRFPMKTSYFTLLYKIPVTGGRK
jgi:hypothetical protein